MMVPAKKIFFPAVNVGNPAKRQKKHGRGQQIGSGHPAQGDRIYFEFFSDGREGNINRGADKRNDKGTQAGDKQNGPFECGIRISQG